MAMSALDRVFQELASEARSRRPGCRSRALLPTKDAIAFLQRLASCRPQDRALAVVAAPELHCFLALQELPEDQGMDALGQTQCQVIEALCEPSYKSEAPPVAKCSKALRTIFLHYESNELVSVRSTAKLLHECAKKGFWDVARLVVGRLCAHMKSAELTLIEQKVLGALRDSLVPVGVCCLAVLLEPLHKIVFLHLSALMAQGSAPEVGTFPPAIKWYLRLLRKCAGMVVAGESQSAADVIKKLDIDFLFWPFLVPSASNQKEARDWSSRYAMEIKSWRDSLIDQLRSDLRMPKATDVESVNEDSCYNWLPFAEYALSSDQWIWLHDLLRHSRNIVKDIESRQKQFLEISATGGALLGIGAALVEILAHELRTCKHHQLGDPLSQAECCGCMHNDSKSAGNAAALLVWLLRPDSLKPCDSTWVIIVNSLLLSTFTTRESFAIQFYDPSGELLSERVDPGFTHESKVPLPAIDSTVITLVQNEKDLLLNKWRNGAIQQSTQAFKQAEGSKWKLEEVVWPALLNLMSSCCSYSFTCHQILEILETFGPRRPDDTSKDQSPFPVLKLHMEHFVRLVKLSPRLFLPLLSFSLSTSKVAATNCFKSGNKKNHQPQDRLDLCELQEEEYMAAIFHCVLQESEGSAHQPDVLLLQVAAFSGGSFRYLVGECELIKPDVMQKSETQSNSNIFAQKKGDSSGLVTAIEGRRLLAWKLRTWTKERRPQLDALKKIYIWVSALCTKFPLVETWIGVGLSELGRVLRVQEEEALWEREVTNNKADKRARSAKRPRLSSSTPSAAMNLNAEGEDDQWIVEALCRSTGTLERYLTLYLGLNYTRRKKPSKTQAAGSKHKTSSGFTSLQRQNVVSYLAKNPSQIPNLSSLCRNTSVYEVACEAIQEAAKNKHESDIFELWFQFLEKLREVGTVPSVSYLENGSLLQRLTTHALNHATLLSDWPQELLETLVSESPGFACRICEEIRERVEEKRISGCSFSGVVAAVDIKPQVVAHYLESTLVASQSPKSTSSLLDLLSILFALCKPESRTVMLLHFQDSGFYKSTLKGCDAAVKNAEESQCVQKDFFLAVVFWRFNVLKDLKSRRGALTSTDAFQMDLRAAICHVLSTSEPQLHPEGDQTHSSVSGEEMISQLQGFAPLEDNPNLCVAINSWILFCCRVNVRLNLDHILALCRLHPALRDALIKGIEKKGKKKEARGKLSEELKEGLLHGLLTWLPPDGRSHFTTTVGVPSEFWLESNKKGVAETMSCLSSSDVGVRRSAFYLVVTHQHHHHVISSLTLELCNKVASSELNREQESLLGVLIPVLMSESHLASKIVDSVMMLFRQAKELSGGEGSSSAHVKALLRVALLACEASPFKFATEETALLLITLAMVEDPSEEIVVGALQCLEVLAPDLQGTFKEVKLLQDMLLHLVYKPAGDYVWHLAMSFADKFTAGVAHKQQQENNSTSNFPIQELLRRCPLQRSVPLQTFLKRLDYIKGHFS